MSGSGSPGQVAIVQCVHVLMSTFSHSRTWATTEACCPSELRACGRGAQVSIRTSEVCGSTGWRVPRKTRTFLSSFSHAIRLAVSIMTVDRRSRAWATSCSTESSRPWTLSMQPELSGHEGAMSGTNGGLGHACIQRPNLARENSGSPGHVLPNEAPIPLCFSLSLNPAPPGCEITSSEDRHGVARRGLHPRSRVGKKTWARHDRAFSRYAWAREVLGRPALHHPVSFGKADGAAHGATGSRFDPLTDEVTEGFGCDEVHKDKKLPTVRPSLRDAFLLYMIAGRRHTQPKH